MLALPALAVTLPPISVACEFPAPLIESVGDYTRVQVENCDTLRRVGAPLIPFRLVRVLLPPGHGVAQIENIGGEEVDATLGMDRVEYGRHPRFFPTDRFGTAPAVADSPDPTIYGSADPYPAVRAELAAVQHMAGYGVALIRVYPVQYLPAAGELRYVTNLEVTVTLEPLPESQRPLSPPARARLAARSRLQDWVNNPGMLDAYETGRGYASNEDGADYLLITKNDLVPSFQPLLGLKEQSGLATRVATVETINQETAGSDLPERIRNTIRAAYTNSGITYVLLAGDTATVPCRYAHVNMGSLVSSPPVLPSDLYFACLDGSWNSDGDDRWGESTDGEGGSAVDVLGEVYVGRLPVDTPAEAEIVVDKTLRYATEAHPRRTNALFLAEFLADTPSGAAQGGDMFDPLVPLFDGFDLTWLDDRSTVPPWTRADAMAELNLSPHLVLFNGHGNDDTLIGLAEPFARAIRTAHLDDFHNASPFLAYSVGCNVGQFDNDRFSPDCIGEELLKRHGRGAFAAVLNSRLGWYDQQNEAKYSGEFQERFFQHVLTQGAAQFGAANQLAKHDLIGQLETDGIMTYRWCYYEITLLGDPHLAWQQLDPVGDPTDTDGDGAPDWQEDIAGTNPTDNTSVLRVRVERLGPGGVARLEWPSVPGRSYALWSATDLSASGFVVLTNDLAATPPTNVFADDRPAAAARFYRLEVRLLP